MKIIIFFTLVCALEAGFPFVESKRGVEDSIISLENQVTRVISELRRYKGDFSFKLSQQLSAEALNTMQAINDITNPALASIKNDVQKAKEEGKDADSCYESARQGLSESSKNGFKEIDQCKVDASSIVKPYLDSIDNTIKTGNDLKFKLTNILLNCMSGDYWDQQNCIIAQLPAAASSVNLLKKSGGQLQTDNYSWLNEVMAQARPCFSQARSKVFDDSLGIRRAASNCINNL